VGAKTQNGDFVENNFFVLILVVYLSDRRKQSYSNGTRTPGAGLAQ
jgi:hypothetical protein